MEEERPSYYAIIPAEVRYDKNLKANEKLLYGEITALAGRTGECWASNKYFADLYEVEPETISRWISNLKNQGYIRVEITYKEDTKEIDKRVIQIGNTPIDEKINTPLIKKSIPLDEKIKGNNTSINNTSNNKKKEINKERKEKLIEYIESQFGRTINSLEYETIMTWEDTPAVRQAIDQAVKNGAFNIRYIQTIISSKPKKTVPSWINQEIPEDTTEEPDDDFMKFIEEFRNEKRD